MQTTTHRGTKGHAGPILGSDPDAIAKLENRLKAMEAEMEWMRKINWAYKKAGWPAVKSLNPSATLISAGMSNLRFDCYGRRPFPAYAFSNLRANIRRVAKRIEDITARLAIEPREIDFEGGSVEIDPEEDRIRLRFDERLDRDDYRWMRSRGFRFSRSHGAFQRHCNAAGEYAVVEAVSTILDLKIEI